jgi:hypothetical protein
MYVIVLDDYLCKTKNDMYIKLTNYQLIRNTNTHFAMIKLKDGRTSFVVHRLNNSDKPNLDYISTRLINQKEFVIVYKASDSHH